VFYYFPFAGRGEISRLCAAAGGLKIEEKNFSPQDERAAICKECGAIGTGLPILKHGNNLSMCQSSAIQNYICAIGPRFKDVPMRVRAIDAMYFAHVEDMLAEIGKSGIFGELFGGPPTNTDELKSALEKWCKHLESQVPSAGFIAGQAFPTGSDCVILCLYRGVAPWKIFFDKSGVNKADFPKLKSLEDRTAQAPGIKEYLERSTSISLNPFSQ